METTIIGYTGFRVLGFRVLNPKSLSPGFRALGLVTVCPPSLKFPRSISVSLRVGHRHEPQWA